MGEQRKQLLVKKKFQQTMILEVLLITFILVNLIVCTSYFIIESVSETHTLKLYLAYSVASLEIIGFFIVYRYNLKVSHRIAGPVYRFESALQSLQEGDVSMEIRLRNKDEFQEIAAQFNKTVDLLREKILSAQEISQQLRKSDAGNPELLRELDETLAYFRTEQSLSPEEEG